MVEKRNDCQHNQSKKNKYTLHVQLLFCEPELGFPGFVLDVAGSMWVILKALVHFGSKYG